MAEKRIFYITANSLSVFFWKMGHIESGPCFKISENGLTAFCDYVSQDNDILTYCLVDLIEEQFHHDTIPHVTGNDRKMLLARKSRQLFRHTPYHSAIVQGRESGGRKNCKVLYVGVTNPETLSVWLTQAEQHKVPIVGVYSLAEFAQHLCLRLNMMSANALIYTQQSVSGFRQTFLNSGKVKVSRLSQSKRLHGYGYDTVVVSEVFRNQKYLQRLRLLENNAPLDVYVFGDGQQLIRHNDSFVDTDDIKYHFVDEQEVAEVIGLKSKIDFGQCEYLFIHLLCTSKSVIDYAQKTDLRYKRMYQARKGMLVASLLLLASGLTLSVLNGVKTHHINQQNNLLLQEVKQLQKKHDNALAKLPTLMTTARNMQHAVETSEQLTHKKTNPVFAMIAISGALETHPNIIIDEIDWIWSQNSQTKISDNHQAEVDENLEYDQVETKLYQIATIRARVSPFDGNYDYAFARVNSFVKKLRNNPIFKEVSPVKLPLDTNPTSSLAGVTGYKLEHTLARFEIRVVLSVGHENS